MTSIRFVRPTLWALVSAMLLALSVGVQAEDNWPEPNYLHRNTVLDIEVGYFSALRKDFRTVYGDGVGFALALEHRESTHWSWRLRAEYESLSEVSDNLRYWHISACPIITYTFAESSTVRRMIGAGVGVDVRTIRVTYIFAAPDGPDIVGVDELSDTKVEPMAMLYLGLDLRPNRSVSLGIHLYFDHHFQGDTSRGAFGDTGGLHVMGSLGIWI